MTQLSALDTQLSTARPHSHIHTARLPCVNQPNVLKTNSGTSRQHNKENCIPYTSE